VLGCISPPTSIELLETAEAKGLILTKAIPLKDATVEVPEDRTYGGRELVRNIAARRKEPGNREVMYAALAVWANYAQQVCLDHGVSFRNTLFPR